MSPYVGYTNCILDKLQSKARRKDRSPVLERPAVVSAEPTEQVTGLRHGRTYLYLLSCQVLCAPKHVALGNPFTAQLMNLDHSAKSDKPHQSIRRQQAQGHLEGLLQCLQVLLFQTRVDNIQEDQWCLWTSLTWKEMHLLGAYVCQVTLHNASRQFIVPPEMLFICIILRKSNTHIICPK